MDRRTFTLTGTVTLLGLAAKMLAQQTNPPSTSAPSTSVTPSAATPQAPVRPPALAAELVKESVIAAYVNLEKTKTMLAAEPGLVNATWDWGGGDFEQAIGGVIAQGAVALKLRGVEELIGGRVVREIRVVDGVIANVGRQLRLGLRSAQLG